MQAEMTTRMMTTTGIRIAVSFDYEYLEQQAALSEKRQAMAIYVGSNTI